MSSVFTVGSDKLFFQQMIENSLILNVLAFLNKFKLLTVP